jgi:DNA-binding response OmpR family regulator
LEGSEIRICGYALEGNLEVASDSPTRRARRGGFEIFKNVVDVAICRLRKKEATH